MINDAWLRYCNRGQIVHIRVSVFQVCLLYTRLSWYRIVQSRHGIIPGLSIQSQYNACSIGLPGMRFVNRDWHNLRLDRGFGWPCAQTYTRQGFRVWKHSDSVAWCLQFYSRRNRLGRSGSRALCRWSIEISHLHLRISWVDVTARCSNLNFFSVMHTTSMRAMEAIEHLKQSVHCKYFERTCSPGSLLAVRPTVHPNYGFLKQLEVFEACHCSISDESSEYITWKRKHRKLVSAYVSALADITTIIPGKLHLCRSDRFRFLTNTGVLKFAY